MVVCILRLCVGVNWEGLRRKLPPIVPEHTDEADTTNFVRLAGVISEKEDFYSFIPTDKTVTSNMVIIVTLKFFNNYD